MGNAMHMLHKWVAAKNHPEVTTRLPMARNLQGGEDLQAVTAALAEHPTIWVERLALSPQGSSTLIRDTHEVGRRAVRQKLPKRWDTVLLRASNASSWRAAVLTHFLAAR